MIRFSLNDSNKVRSSIRADIYVFGYQIPKGLSISIYSADWDKRRQRMKPLRAESGLVNNMLDQLTTRFRNLELRYKVSRIVPSKAEFCYELFKEDQFIQKRSTNIFSEIREFIDKRKKIVSNLTSSRFEVVFRKLKLFKPNLYTIDDSFIKEFSDHLLSKKLGSSTVAKNLEFVYQFCEYKKIKVTKIKLKIIKPDKTYLSLSEIDKLIELKLDNKKLDQSRDLFVFQCYTGFRDSDLKRFNKNWVYEYEGSFFIENLSQKTGCRAIVPVFNPVDAIFKKYNNDLPFRQNSIDYNLCIKEICKLAGICNTIHLYKVEGERKIPYSIEKYKAISTHTGRRSFSTNMSILGFTDKKISLMMGLSKIDTVSIYNKTEPLKNAKSVIDSLNGIL